MMLLKSIVVLSLITLTNITQAFYVALDDGEATTSTSTCLKGVHGSSAVTKECSDANEFILENNKFCFKKERATCLSNSTSASVRTLFTQDDTKHIAVTEFNEAGGYLHVDYMGQAKKYKYSVIDKMFIKDYVQPIKFPSSNGHWRSNEEPTLCWTSRNYFHAIFLNPCRSSRDNIRRGNKIQFWKYENDVNGNGGVIKSDDGVMCVIVKKNRIYAIRCDLVEESHNSTFKLLSDREIATLHRPAMCLVPRQNGRKIIILGPCVRKVKFVNSIE